MQPEVTVALATIWLLVSLLGGRGAAAATLHPSYLPPDQYSPLPPRHPQVYQTVGGQLYWKDQDDQPFDLSIAPRRSLLLDEAPRDLLRVGYPAKDYTRRPEDRSDNFPLLKVEQAKQAENVAGTKLPGEGGGVDNGGRKAENQESFSSEASPPGGAEDPFVGDDTFQDQGPGSVEIYKLDLVKEKALLSPSSTTKAPMKNKSKVPKKTSHLNWKAKTAESKTSSPKILHRQSNFFDELQTDIPPNSESFGVGGVPELQVGCEGLEASSHKLKRSIDSPAKEKTPRSEGNPLLGVTPISIDLEYDLSGEEAYEEMDELVKLKKLESTTKRPKHKRGDMDATLHGNEFFAGKKLDKLPVRGDLGESSTASASNLQPPALLANNRTHEKDVNHYANKARKLLSLEDPPDENARARNKRSDWGYGEEEGVVSSDELQTENQRRRQHYERLRLEELRRREEGRNQSQTQIHDIRQEYENMLEQRKREEEERRRRLEQDASQRTLPNRWRDGEEERRRLYEEHLRRMQYNQPNRNYQTTERPRIDERFNHQPHRPANDYRPRQHAHQEEERQREQQRLEAERRRQEYEEVRRKHQEEQQRRAEENQRRREQNRGEDGPRRNLSAEEERRLEDRRREWMEKEEERRREESVRTQPPSNLVYPHRSAANETRQRDPEAERRMRESEERERERKLREYIQRNQPINVSRSSGNRRDESPESRSPEAERRDDPYRNMTSRRELEEEHRRRAEEYRRRHEEDRRSEEEARRKQSLGSGAGERRVTGEAGSYDYFRYPGTEIERRGHGPSAPAYGSPRGYAEDERRRQEARRVEDERQQREEVELRKEMLRREEALRRMQSRRYEEERKRQEALRQESERRRKELVEEQARRSHAGRNRPVENRRPEYEDHRFQQHRRRPDTSLVPGNLVFDEARRAAERERQRQEQERRRLEAERRRQEEDRLKEARKKEEHDRAMREQLRRHEEARLNALPVSARIIIRPVAATTVPQVSLRTGFDNGIKFTGLNPYGQGVPASKFPAPPTLSPPAQSPGPCVWAVVQCCPTNKNRLVTCFESMGCPGINWDPNPCRGSIAKAARDEVAKFYAAAEKNEHMNS